MTSSFVNGNGIKLLTIKSNIYLSAYIHMHVLHMFVLFFCVYIGYVSVWSNQAKKYHYPSFIKLILNSEMFIFSNALWSLKRRLWFCTFIGQQVKCSNISPNIKLSSHSYYESHLIMAYYVLIFCLINFANILVAFALIFRFQQQFDANFVNRTPKALFCSCSETF